MQANTIAEIAGRYGPNGTNPKLYHHDGHATLVTRSTTAINRRAGASQRVILLSEVGATNHDREQDLGSIKNEKASSKLAVVSMRETDLFDTSDEESVEEIIDGTIVVIDGPHIYQRAADLGVLARRVADADLSALGMPPEISWPIAKSFHYECRPNDLLVGETLVDYALFQIEVQKNHEFFTNEARECFPYKQDNIDFLKHIVRTALDV